MLSQIHRLIKKNAYLNDAYWDACINACGYIFTRISQYLSIHLSFLSPALNRFNSQMLRSAFSDQLSESRWLYCISFNSSCTARLCYGRSTSASACKLAPVRSGGSWVQHDKSERKTTDVCFCACACFFQRGAGLFMQTSRGCHQCGTLFFTSPTPQANPFRERTRRHPW